MNTKHIFVSVLDINEQLPFVIHKKKKLQDTFQEQDRAKKSLTTFVKELEKNFGEPLSYLGMDVVGEKSYERFMFKKSGFFEVMVEAPVAMTAHFPDKKRGKQFADALKKTLKKTLSKVKGKELLIDSIQVQDEEDTSLTVEDWHKIKRIRN
jgi:hypothetical protein